jgi:hypothetical protein
MLLRSIDRECILIEEISIPSSTLPSKTNWKKWMEEGAPGHTSWIMYEVDATSFTLIEAYSFTRKGWLFVSEEQDFLTKLLRLSLTKLKEDNRKKTGPAPLKDEPDYRKIWHPSIQIEGKKQKIQCDAFKAMWPDDDTILSGCNITMYFPSEGPSFFFPHWIEASNGHYTHAIKTVEAGRGMVSSLAQSIPRRPPKIHKISKNTDKVFMQVVGPSYHKKFTVYAFDITKPFEHIGPLPFTYSSQQTKGYICLEASQHFLASYLKEGHRYKWIIIPEQSAIFYVESEDIFLWPNVGSK